jgi:hypothetical protein
VAATMEKNNVAYTLRQQQPAHCSWNVVQHCLGLRTVHTLAMAAHTHRTAWVCLPHLQVVAHKGVLLRVRQRSCCWQRLGTAHDAAPQAVAEAVLLRLSLLLEPVSRRRLLCGAAAAVGVIIGSQQHRLCQSLWPCPDVTQVCVTVDPD